MKLAFVVPRWAPEVRGGAETAARGVAEHLVDLAGWDVEVFTTRALDHFTWADALPEGDEVVNGVTVHRFSSQGVRFDEDPDFAGRVMHAPRAAGLEEGRRWVEMLGPSSPAMVDAVAASDADLVVFTPYLFAPTLQGVPRVGRRAVMVPAAHDEPLLRLRAYHDAFGAAGGFVYYTAEERALVEERFGVAHRPGAVLGLGVDPPPDPLPGAEALPEELADTPYLVCLGRVEEGKGSRLLARCFEVYKQRRPGDLRLVLAGPATQTERYTHPDVLLTGAVDETTKWALLRHAEAFVTPSPYESFSIVLMEAWLAGLPALVNGRCAVTRGHAARSGGGLWFDDYPAFEAALDRLSSDPGLRSRLGSRGAAYVRSHYDWAAVTERYRRFLEDLASRVHG